MNPPNNHYKLDKAKLEYQETTEVDPGDDITVGQWYWVLPEPDEEIDIWLGCVTYIGSNFVKVVGPGGSYERVHFNEVGERMKLESDAETVIQKKVDYYQGEVRKRLKKVQAITARLGVSGQRALGEGKDTTPGTALAKLSGTDNIKKHKAALVRAKDKSLPKLFEEIKGASEEMAHWVSASIIPLEADTDHMEDCIDGIKDRIFNISLYAGLMEDITEIATGKPAGFAETLHVMQRRLYMDEECLANYRHGGMSFEEIDEFHEWLCEPENLNRVFPFLRCIVAFRVRRDIKEREFDGQLSTALINIRLEGLDKLTFLYIRNGEQLHCLECDLDFGSSIFPDKKDFDPTEPMMVRMFANSVDKMIPVREYEVLFAEAEEEARLHDKWEEDNPGKSWIHNPHRHHDLYELRRWKPFDSSNVYFDDALQEVADKIKHYNRIALVIQGLYDRSEVLHPHPPAKLWDPNNFASLIKLVYDDENVLHYGEPPSFEEYRDKCNASIKVGSLTVGQEDFWEEREAVKETNRLDNDWRTRGDYRPTRFSPMGNPGPGFLVRVAVWRERAKKATYKWVRERLRNRYRWANRADTIPCTIRVPADRLFNVSAYKLGDYKQFFQDSRTRAGYLKWASVLLSAEEYHAGNLKVEKRP